MEDAILDPIQRSQGEADTNGEAQNPEPNTVSISKGKEELGGSGEGVSSSSGKSSKNRKTGSNNESNNVIVRRERPTRACTTRPPKYVDRLVTERRSRPAKKEKVEKVAMEEDVDEDNEEGDEVKEQCGKVVTSLVNPPTTEQMPRWRLRSMWELASVLNFFHIFRPLLNITAEFSAEELESALLNPNSTLGDVHIPLLKSIPPVTRMAYGSDTWITVLCRKLRDWWHWVAEGELPIVASHGAELEAYKNLDPAVRVVILKALCDIRVEQDDIRGYIDNSVKHGVQLSAFRKERIGGDSHGISYWYEDDELIGHRLYREIRKVDRKAKKAKTMGSHILQSTSYEWETVATNLDEFLDVSEKLFSSKSRTEVSLGRKLKNYMLPEIEKIHKRKEKLLKKQHRQALLLDNFVAMDGLGPGRSLRDRKPVTYTFDDFDRSINEAIKITKRKQPSPEPGVGREMAKSDSPANSRWNGFSHASVQGSFSPADFDEMDEECMPEPLDRSNRRRQRSQRYSGKEYVDAMSDTEEYNDEYVDSDDDIVGEAVYDEEYLELLKQKKRVTSSSEGEGDWSEENGEDEGEEEDIFSSSEDSDQPRRKFKETEGRTRRGTKLQSVDHLQRGLRRSERATRNRIDYRQYELSESDTESVKRKGTKESETHQSDATDNTEYSMENQESDPDEVDDKEQRGIDFEHHTPMPVQKDENQPSTKTEIPNQDEPHNQASTKSERPIDDEPNGPGRRRFLDLNELAPGSCFDDGPGALVKNNDGKGE